ncbi:MAG: ribosome maturation factor RimM [Armatimonadota bacterium]|nr:ribosome maturation factor RimM [Armatimonadota bacterium]MDR7519039.1 ribosome maturation factor RimM [Armatimonadota bacterium]MDR7549182.1 ribosome maturation factor RimM [Armatimonadota bacterium]
MASSSRSARARAPRASAGRAAGRPADLVTVGRVAAPHGLRGEVRVALETDFPQRFAGLRTAYLVQGGRVEPVEIAGSRPHRGGVLLSLRGIDDAEAAGRLRGAAIAVPREAVVPLGPDEFYVFEVVGLWAVAEDGRPLGTVEAVMRGPAHDVYVIRGDAGEVLVPAVREVVRRIDLERREMVVALPHGLGDERHAH